MSKGETRKQCVFHAFQKVFFWFYTANENCFLYVLCTVFYKCRINMEKPIIEEMQASHFNQEIRSYNNQKLP